jgi:DNA-binding transcriptional MerR regulator
MAYEAHENIALTSPQLAKLLALSPRMPTLWAERGYLEPSLRDAEGRGTKRLWSRQDAVHALAVKQLIAPLSTVMLRYIRKIVSVWPDSLKCDVIWKIGLEEAQRTRILFYTEGEPIPHDKFTLELTGTSGSITLAGLEKADEADHELSKNAMVEVILRIGRLYDFVDRKLTIIEGA